MFPALQDVADRVGDVTPVVVGALDDLEEGRSVLGLFAPAGGQASGGRGERAEVGVVETAVEGAGEGGVGDEDEIEGSDVGVEGVGGFGSGEWHRWSGTSQRNLKRLRLVSGKSYERY